MRNRSLTEKRSTFEVKTFLDKPSTHGKTRQTCGVSHWKGASMGIQRCRSAGRTVGGETRETDALLQKPGKVGTPDYSCMCWDQSGLEQV